MERKVVIITGLSGSGKSTAARTLEDLGFFCVDNIPVDLLPKLLELTEARGEDLEKLALVIDLRQRGFFTHYHTVLDNLELEGTNVEILFFTARDEVLIRRYSETRRQHPMAYEGGVEDGIRKERNELEEIKKRADWVIDTSELNVHQLREEIRKIYGHLDGKGIKVVVNSFGFGRGIPRESDMILDVRFLPNPYFVEELKNHDGREPEVADWIHSHETTRKFIEKLDDMLFFLLPLYIKEGKQYFTISVGCTGGRHRSVAIAESIGRLLENKGYRNSEVRHRELTALPPDSSKTEDRV